MMDYNKKHEISVYLTEEQLDKRIAEIGAEITKRFAGESVYLVCILKGSIFFTTELAKRIELPMTMDFMSVSSYGAETRSSGVVNVKKDLSSPLKAKMLLSLKISWTAAIHSAVCCLFSKAVIQRHLRYAPCWISRIAVW